jgi:hypothetical protein
MDQPGATNEWREIVGIVGDTRREGLTRMPIRPRLRSISGSSISAPFERTMTLVVRTAVGDAASLTPLIRCRSRASIHNCRGLKVRPWTALIVNTINLAAAVRARLSSHSLALVLTAAGLYGDGVRRAADARDQRAHGARCNAGQCSPDVPAGGRR